MRLTIKKPTLIKQVTKPNLDWTVEINISTDQVEILISAENSILTSWSRFFFRSQPRPKFQSRPNGRDSLGIQSRRNFNLDLTVEIFFKFNLDRDFHLDPTVEISMKLNLDRDSNLAWTVEISLNSNLDRDIHLDPMVEISMKLNLDRETHLDWTVEILLKINFDWDLNLDCTVEISISTVTVGK